MPKLLLVIQPTPGVGDWEQSISAFCTLVGIIGHEATLVQLWSFSDTHTKQTR